MVEPLLASPCHPWREAEWSVARNPITIMLPLGSGFRQLSATRQSSRRRKFGHPIGWIVRSANRLGTDQSLLASTQRNFGAFSYLRCAHPWKLSILHSGSRCHRQGPDVDLGSQCWVAECEVQPPPRGALWALPGNRKWRRAGQRTLRKFGNMPENSDYCKTPTPDVPFTCGPNSYYGNDGTVFTLAQT